MVTPAHLAAAPAEENAMQDADLQRQPGMVLAEFVYQKAPFPECHASTIAESPRALAAAWFGGTEEGHQDVGIWAARRDDRGWSTPVEVANGVQADGERYPCWNPVLFQPKTGPLMLFYKVGPSPRSWWGMVTTLDDALAATSPPRRLPDGILGPIKNKPVQLPGGEILCGSSTEHAGWRVHFEITPDLGKTWQRIGPVNDGKEFAAIQPTLLRYPDGRLQALCRSRQDRIVQVWSADGATTWNQMTATELPNPNSGIDGVTLHDGRQLLVYNHTIRGGRRPHDREMLNVAVSRDGKQWKAALVLENQPGEFSYPAAIQTADGLVHATYTWKRQRIKHVVLDPAKLVLRDMPDGKWPR
ncbi:MAG: sialidase [Planctomycetes bacterium RBG_13_63_9]|nr:MAG: sialidase [Planctomycetes bacterium RBG_13_63_9]